MLRYAFYTCLIGLIIIGAIFATGPREPLDPTLTFKATQIGDDVEAYVREGEAATPGIRPGAEAEIIWADPSLPAKTDIALVYLHGFSATKHEIRPVPDRVASELGANVYYARLRGHGRDGDALAAATAGEWWNDTAEAIEIGRRLGDRVVLIGASTGATLATLALADADVGRGVAGLVAISPNYLFRGAPLALLTMPYAREILPPLMGDRREWEPFNEDQGLWWTTSYPSVAVLPMAATVSAAEAVDVSQITQPAMMVFVDDDQVVDHSVTREVAAKWGGAVAILNPEPAPSEAPSRHIITGDIIAPSQTLPVAETIISWIRALK